MYLQRNYVHLAKRYLQTFPVLCLVGPRQAGKTSFAKQLAPDWRYFDLERPSDFNLIHQAPEVFFDQFPNQIIIDEAQESPQLFKLLRSVVDQDRDQKGRFILTESSSPEITAHLSDSLAGRVGIIEVGTLKANEYYEKPLSPLYSLFANSHTRKTIDLPSNQLTNTQVRHLWLYGGYPEPLLANDQTIYRDWMNNYLTTYIQRDISKLFPRLNKQAYQRFVTTLSSLSGTIINKADLARTLEINQKSVAEYLQIAAYTYLWSNIPYDSESQIKSLVKHPKGLLNDSGLLHFLQRINDFEQLLAHPACGHSFECFVMSELMKGIMASGIGQPQFNYYRSAKGAEVDLIVTTSQSKIPIEIKMQKTVPLKKLSALNKYIEDNKLPFGLLINQCDSPFWLNDRILQIPIGML